MSDAQRQTFPRVSSERGNDEMEVLDKARLVRAGVIRVAYSPASARSAAALSVFYLYFGFGTGAFAPFTSATRIMSLRRSTGKPLRGGLTAQHRHAVPLP